MSSKTAHVDRRVYAACAACAMRMLGSIAPRVPDQRKLSGHYIEIYNYPEGKIDLRANGVILAYTIFDQFTEIDQVAIVDKEQRTDLDHPGFNK